MPDSFNKNSYKKYYRARVHLVGSPFDGTFSIYMMFPDTRNSSTKTACYARIVKYKNNSIVKSVLLICSRIYLREKMHSRESLFLLPLRRFSFLRTDRFNQHLRHHFVNYRITISTRYSAVDYKINSIRSARLVESGV